MMQQKESVCPCGGGPFTECCGRFLTLGQHADTALALMRSRYTAYVLADVAYLRSTWHPDHVPADLDTPLASPPRWIGLTIIAYQVIDTAAATVEFVARYKVGGRAYRLHECSRFERLQDGRWYYRGQVSGVGDQEKQSLKPSV